MHRFPASLLAAAVLAGCGSPTKTVDALMDAIAARDSAAVAQYMDVQRVAESAVDPILEAATSNPALVEQGGLSIEMLQGFRPMIAPLMEQLFWQLLIDPDGVRRGPLGDMIPDLDVDFGDLAAHYAGIEYEEGRDDGSVEVGVRITGADESSMTTVPFVLEKVEGVWQVVGFGDLAASLAALAENR